MFELLEAEQRVAEINVLVERQRQLIEDLAYEGHDTTSAQIVFDSLVRSLSLHVQDRHRLRVRLNLSTAKAGEYVTGPLLSALAPLGRSADNCEQENSSVAVA
jgi:hypothetical protein